MNAQSAIGCTCIFAVAALGVLAIISETGSMPLTDIPWQITYLIGVFVGMSASIIGGEG